MIDYITAIGISLASIHSPYTGQNQFNPGLHLEIGDVRTGIYYNSRSAVTGYMGYSLPLISLQQIRIGALVALGSGYASPVIGGLEFTVGQHLVVLVTPKIDGYASASVGFAVRIPIQ